MQYKLDSKDMEMVLALVRGNTLASAGLRLGVDGSTVFRAVQRIEKGLGKRIFERSRQGYIATDLALEVARQAEHIESAIEAARSVASAQGGQPSGRVSLATTDTLSHGLLMPVLSELAHSYPLLDFNLAAKNELVSLTRRDADIAIRATKAPPEHLVGKHLGSIRVAIFAGEQWRHIKDFSKAPWIAPDDELPEHPSVLWRKKHFPKLIPKYKVDTISSVMEAITSGLGIGILPYFLTQGRTGLHAITDELTEAQSQLWILTHPEVRHLHRVSTIYNELMERIPTRLAQLN